jgi:hypothetical protein
MNHREFSEAAESLRADGVHLEEWLVVDSSTIEQWESGERRIPRIRANQLTWLLRQNENDRRVKAANLQRALEAAASKKLLPIPDAWIYRARTRHA